MRPAVLLGNRLAIALRDRHHIYMTDDSRINIGGLRADNLEYFAQAVAQVLGRTDLAASNRD